MDATPKEPQAKFLKLCGSLPRNSRQRSASELFSPACARGASSGLEFRIKSSDPTNSEKLFENVP